MRVQCDICFKSLKRESLSEHKAHLHERTTGIFKCNHCPLILATKFLRKSHYNAEHRKRLQCQRPACTFKFTSKTHLAKHENRAHLGNKDYGIRFNCEFPTCQRGFTNRVDLDRHFKTHSGQKDYACMYCPHKFTRRTGLEIHLRTHTQEKPFPCLATDCDYRSHRKDLLNQHIWYRHPPLRERLHWNPEGGSAARINCPFCKRQFLKGGLENHMRTHIDERPFACELCEYRGKEAGTLREHMLRIHSDPTPLPRLSCTICLRTFKFAQNLKNHMRTVHLNTLRFTKCTVCRKKFMRVDSLMRHYIVKHVVDLNVQVVAVKLPN